MMTISGRIRRFAVLLATAAAPAAGQGPVIAAASDLNTALPEIAAIFTRHTGEQVRISFGSSGNLTQQILNGAPFEVFLSADERYVERLRAAGKTDGTGEIYAVGRIGLFAPRDSRLTVDSLLHGLRQMLNTGTLRKLAIANPEHAPYGRAARDALSHAGLWKPLQSHLVTGENVAQATQFAMSGSVDGAIIPLSAALTDAVRKSGAFTLIPESWHTPLRQRAVVIRGASATARRFFEFLQSPAAIAVLRRYGFKIAEHQ